MICHQIVFQIQRLLETNCNTDLGPPLKIKFTWDPSYWTKQLSNLGKKNTLLFIRQVPKARQDRSRQYSTFPKGVFFVLASSFVPLAMF